MCWYKPAPHYRLLALALFTLIHIPGHATDMQADPAPVSDAVVEPAATETENDDWDWSGITAEDSTPAEVVSKPRLPDSRKNRRPAVASPDFEATTRPATEVFADVPPFEVIPGKKDTDMHPCSNCHQWTKGNTTARTLKQPHDNFELKHGLHGKGKFWCMTCHHLDGPGGLVTLEGVKLDFDDAYLVCSQCHANQARDWVYGAHGKRIGNWQGARQVLNCTACHYQHRPAIEPRAPLPGPVVRMGLERPSHWKPLGRGSGINGHNHREVWQ